MANIIDVGVPSRNRAYILSRGMDMVGCALAALVLGTLYARFAARAGQGFGAALREAEYRRVQSFSFSNMFCFSVRIPDRLLFSPTVLSLFSRIHQFSLCQRPKNPLFLLQSF